MLAFNTFRARITEALASNQVVAHTLSGIPLEHIIGYTLFVIRLVREYDREVVIFISSCTAESLFISLFGIFLDCKFVIVPPEFDAQSPIYEKLYRAGMLQSVLVVSSPGAESTVFPSISSHIRLPSYLDFIRDTHPQQGLLKSFKHLYPDKTDQEYSNSTVYFTSSGSTGTPKIIPLSINNLSSCFKSCDLAIFSGLDFQNICCVHSVSFVIVLPYIYAFLSNRHASFSCVLSTSSAFPAFQLKKALEQGQVSRPLIISVPTILRTLFQSPTEFGEAQISVISCGEPLDASLALNIDKYASSFFNLYGSTEVSPWIMYLNASVYLSRKYESGSLIDSILPVGTCLPGVKYSIKRETNELLVDSDSVFSGYINAETPFEEVNGTDYFNTGDMFELGPEYLYCKGRSNSAVKLCGMFVNPFLIEAMLKQSLAHEDLICICDRLRSRLVIVFMNVSDDDQVLRKVSSNYLKELLNSSLPSGIGIRVVFQRDSPQHLSSGKIDRHYYNSQPLDTFGSDLAPR